MTKIGVAGAAGRMGRALIRAVMGHPQLTLGAAWEMKGHALIGQDAGTLAGLEANGILLGEDNQKALDHCDIIIDFTTPEVTMQTMILAVAKGKGMVIGTTGLSPEQHQTMQKAAQSIPIVYATNFSTGINLLWSLVTQAAQILGEEYNVEIIEAHHNMKKDAPSGTALTLLERLCEAKGLDPSEAAQYGREGLIGPRAKNEVGIHALRAGDIVGDHLVLFAGPGERLELKHQAHSRDTFAQGAVRAAHWLSAKVPGLYHMSDVLNLKN